MIHIIKKSVGVVAVALMLTVGTPSVSAQTPSVAELRLQIAELIKIVAALQAKLALMQNTSPTVSYVWTRPLGVGSYGPDVLKLQMFLNSDPATRVAVSGDGAPGFETQFYGPATAAAVSKFQMKYRSEILTPSGLTAGNGFFGQTTMVKANALAKSTPSSGSTAASGNAKPSSATQKSRGGGSGGGGRDEGKEEDKGSNEGESENVEEDSTTDPVSQIDLEWLRELLSDDEGDLSTDPVSQIDFELLSELSSDS